MISDKLPRILSPNLGCPWITSVETLLETGADIILALHEEEGERGALRIQAVPSHPNEGGQEFSLRLVAQGELDSDALPAAFADVAETRWLISATLCASTFGGEARFWRFRAQPEGPLDQRGLRLAEGAPRPTLYNLVLYRGDGPVHRALHSLCLRPPRREVRFIHLTDLHVAERNDLMAQEVNSTVNPIGNAAPARLLNFNDRLREFIKHANALADAGRLDFVLALGDLVDFVHHGFTESRCGDNNWRVWVDIVTGGSGESARGNTGLRVPMFTTLGNHDWRLFPYPPEFNPAIFGTNKEQIGQFDYLYADTSKAVGAKIEKVHSELISEGSPILARSWWGSVLSLGVNWLELTGLAWDRFSARFLAIAKKTLLGTGVVSSGVILALAKLLLPERFSGLVDWAVELAKSRYFPLEFVVLLGLGVMLVRLLRNWVDEQLLEKVASLIGIESGVRGLHDYFLNVNPYFNYAFSLERCYFLILDTGHDALTAESFWDNGGKKIEHLRVRDNIIGGSPESMGLFPPNENYPYSQIAWLEAVLDCVRRAHHQQPGEDRQCRIVVGLHAPPANLSSRDRARADRLLSSGGGESVLLGRGWPRAFDIHYGTLNHYISEFFYLCLGFRQSAPQEPSGPGVDIVLAGHVHWNMDLLLRKPADTTDGAVWKPEVYYGDFSAQVEQNKGAPNRWWSPLLLQTAACGPPSQTASRNPNFRYITIGENLAIRTLRPLHDDGPGKDRP